MKVFDGEFYFDATAICFKEYKKKEYDAFVASNIPITDLKLRKNIKLHPLYELPDYIKGKTVAGFNNQSYDNQLIMYMIKNTEFNPHQLHLYSNTIIGRTGSARYLRDWWDSDVNQYFNYIDVFKTNHYDNPGRRASLKKLEFSYRKKSIKDLPSPFDEPIKTVKQMQDLITYCCYDCDAQEDCYEKSLDKVKQRLNIIPIYKAHNPRFNCMSWSDVKLGDYGNLVEYCKATGQSEYAVKRNVPKYEGTRIYYKNCIAPYINFQTPQLQDFLEDLKNNSKIVGDDNLKEEIEFGGVVYQFGEGGIHTKDKPRIIKSTDIYMLKDGDVGSQYPSTMIKLNTHPRHLTKDWVINLRKNILERITKWKPLSNTGNVHAKTMSDFIKLSANGGGYGKLKERHNWQYDPQAQLQVTLTCQLEILMLCEKLTLAGFQIVSANTDGLVTWLKRSKEEEYYKLCKEWEREVGNTVLGKLEYTDYKFLAQTAVNDYIAQTTQGKIKRKGDFLIYEDIENDMWHKNASLLIIPLALQEYFVNNTPVKTTINNHNNIYDFCSGVSKTRAFRWCLTQVNSNNTAKSKFNDDRFIRYFIGGNTTLSKMFLRNGRSRRRESFTAVEATSPVTICQYLPREDIVRNNINKYPQLDRNWYINKAQTIINDIEK